MLFLVLLTAFAILCYVLVIFLLFLGLVRLNELSEAPSFPQEKVCILIPFRNELDQLPGIIGDLKAQSYPAHLFSVLLVNDHSTDGSDKLAAAQLADWSNFLCLNLPGGIKGKKEAISFALSHVQSKWIIQTDADCRVGPGFVAFHMSFLEENRADLVAGLLTSREGHGGFLEVFERLDLLALAGTGAGSFSFGRPMMCSGANLLYSKDLFLETRRFDPGGKIPSGDDMFLLIGARKLHRNIAFNSDPEIVVRTSPVSTCRELIRQRIRWGAKSTRYGMADIQMLAVVVMAVNLLVLVSPLFMVQRPETCRLLLPLITVKMLVDFLVLAATSGKTGQIRTLWWYIPVALVHPIYMVMVSIGSLMCRSTWKGRRV